MLNTSFSMKHKKLLVVMLLAIATLALVQCTKDKNSSTDDDPALVAQGKNIFRNDTFGDEDFWSGLLHLDKAMAGSANGGYGAGVSPVTALSVGLKVDSDSLPPGVV